jgi:hypothetical protein
MAGEFDKGGPRDLFGRLARYYDTDSNDPRLNQIVAKVLDKGMDPNQWLDAKIGTRPAGQGIDSGTTDPRKSLRGARPDVKSEEPTGLAEGTDMFFSVPDQTPRRLTNEQYQQIRNMPDDEFRKATDPVANDWIAQSVIAGPFGSAAGQLLRGAPGISALLQGGKVARPIGAGVVGAGEGFATNVAAGGDPKDVVMPTIGAVGRAAGGYASAARDPGTRTGRVIKAIEDVGGAPGLPVVERPARGGLFDDPAYRALPDGDIGTIQMAEQAGQNIRGDLARRMESAGTRLNTAQSGAAARRGGAPVDTTAGVDSLDDIAASNVANETVLNPGVDAAIQRQKAALTRQVPASTILGPDGKPMVPARTANEISLEDLNRAVAAANEAAKFGGDPALKTSYGKRSAGTVAELRRGLDPELDAALDNYAAEAQAASKANDALIGKNSARITDTAAREQRATARLADVGRETKTGINRTRRLDRVLGDEYGDELDSIRARNAAAVIEFGFPNPGRPAATALNAIPQNLTAAEVRMFEPLGRNLDAATGPALLPYWRNIIEEARQADRQRNEDRARSLRGDR